MNLNPVATVLLLAGIVLIYAAVKNKYPQDIIREAMGKPPLHGSIVGDTTQGKSTVKGSSLEPNPNAGVPTVEV